MSTADRIIEEAEQIIRIGKLYLGLSATPLVLLLANISSGLDVETTCFRIVLSVCIFSLFFASTLIWRRIVKNQEIIQKIASERRKLSSKDDIADKVPEGLFSDNISKSDFPLLAYFASVVIGYLSLVLIVFMAIWG